MRRTKQEAAETRETIIDAAEQAFLEQGVSRASLNDIAKRAGVTRGAIYFHFKDKSDIFLAMINRIRFPEEDLIFEAEKTDSVNPIDILEKSCRICFERFEEDPEQQRVVLILSKRCEFIGEIAEMGERLQNAHNDMFNLFTRILKVAERRHMLSPQWTPQNGAYTIISLMRGLMLEWLDSNNAYCLTEIGNQAVSALFTSMRKISEAKPEAH